MMFSGDVEPRILAANVTKITNTSIDVSWFLDALASQNALAAINIGNRDSFFMPFSGNTEHLVTLFLDPGTQYTVEFWSLDSDYLIFDVWAITAETKVAWPETYVNDVTTSSVKGNVMLYGSYEKIQMTISPQPSRMTSNMFELDKMMEWSFAPIDPGTRYEITAVVFGRGSERESSTVEFVSQCAETLLLRKIIQSSGSVDYVLGTFGTCDSIVYTVIQQTETVILNEEVPFGKEIKLHFSADLANGDAFLFVTVKGEKDSYETVYEINRIGFFTGFKLETNLQLGLMHLRPSFVGQISNYTISGWNYFANEYYDFKKDSEGDYQEKYCENADFNDVENCDPNEPCLIANIAEGCDVSITLRPFYLGMPGTWFTKIASVPYRKLEFGSKTIRKYPITGTDATQNITVQIQLLGLIDDIDLNLSPNPSANIAGWFSKSQGFDLFIFFRLFKWFACSNSRKSVLRLKI